MASAKTLMSMILLAVVCLTLISHIWWAPALEYPLFPGVMVHRAIADPRSANHTLAKEKLGFVAELFANLMAYSSLGFALILLRRSPRTAV
jgi:hypothetical protein